jgi:hypothetical protein
MARWTDKRVERLKLLHKECFSATVIAKKLGAAFTKGMVVGKLRRIALEAERAKTRTGRSSSSQAKTGAERAGSLKAAAVKPTRPSRPIILPKPAPVVLPVPSAPAPKGVRLFDLRDCHCRWPIGNDRPARMFCGAPALNASSWCEHHQRIAFPSYGKPAVRTAPKPR